MSENEIIPEQEDYAGSQAIAQLKAIIASEAALKEIRSRSFSGRNPELGKMVNCVCGLRHRSSIVHTQTFAKRWIVENGEKVYTAEELIAGATPETKPADYHTMIKVVLGAKAFARKRRNQHQSYRAALFIQLVHAIIPDEYEQADLDKARTRAKRILANKHGRFGFLPPIWQNTKKETNAETQ